MKQSNNVPIIDILRNWYIAVLISDQNYFASSSAVYAFGEYLVNEPVAASIPTPIAPPKRILSNVTGLKFLVNFTSLSLNPSFLKVIVCLLNDLGMGVTQGVTHFSIPLWNTVAPSGVELKVILSLVPVKIEAHEVVESAIPSNNTIDNLFFIYLNKS